MTSHPYHWATWLPSVLRAAGLSVVTVPGWETRGLSPAAKPFRPQAVVWHHDASPTGDSPGVVAYLVTNFATASAQCWVDRAGCWHLIAAGRAPHAGVTLVGKPDNVTSLGVETDHTTGEAWPAEQLHSLRLGSAAILAHLGRSPSDLEFHATICSPPGRKSDPAGLDLTVERAAVAALIAHHDTEAGMPLTPEDLAKVRALVLSVLRDRSLVGDGHGGTMSPLDALNRAAVLAERS